MGAILGAIIAYLLVSGEQDYNRGEFRDQQNRKKESGQYPKFTKYDETPDQDERWTKNAR